MAGNGAEHVAPRRGRDGDRVAAGDGHRLPVTYHAVLNGRPLGPPHDARLGLPGLAARNVLTVEGEVVWSRTGGGPDPVHRPADGAVYVAVTCYPTSAPDVFCCFDQPDLGAAITLSVTAPAGWECVANSPVSQRPEPGQAGV
jgi:aminopeptidase N